MKFVQAALFLIIGLNGAAALPATPATPPTPDLQLKPKPSPPAQCFAKCTEGYHSFSDPKTGKCGCIPNDKGEKECIEETICVEFDVPMRPVFDPKSKTCSCQPKNVPDTKGEKECLEETICAEFDVPMRPVFDPKSKTCSCQPRSDAENICIAATTCLKGSSPHWNPSKKECSCLKDLPSAATPGNGAPDKPTPTKAPTQTPAPPLDTCTNLKIFCECGDHRMHFDAEKKSCQCPPCAPVVSFGCENLLIYCEGGDHKMHLNPVTKKCECPPVTPAATSSA